MANLFTPRANLFARSTLVAAVAAPVAALALLFIYVRSPYYTGVGVEVEQPVPFSHAHHVAGLGIDCRYCHATVEGAAFAGMPSTETCMNCHRQLWTDTAMLAPPRASWREGRPIRWNRVHDLPDHVYFNHSIHVKKGIGCETCHGRVDRMPLARKAETLFMRWCLDCHRRPESAVRPLERVFDFGLRPPGPDEGAALVVAHGIETKGLTRCSICHR